MRTREQIIDGLINPGVIAIVRTSGPEAIPAAAEAMLAGGVTAMEVTLTTPGALDAIREVIRRFGDRMIVGVGTVLDDEACRRSLDAGAEFVVSPIGRQSLVEVSHHAGRPTMLGVYTPTEAQAAHEAGSDFVKLFPADSLGPAYIRALLAPLPHLRIIPTGGVEAHNAGEFIKAGCAALGVGSSLLSRAVLQKRDWAALTANARQLVDSVAAARRS